MNEESCESGNSWQSMALSFLGGNFFASIAYLAFRYAKKDSSKKSTITSIKTETVDKGGNLTVNSYVIIELSHVNSSVSSELEVKAEKDKDSGSGDAGRIIVNGSMQHLGILRNIIKRAILLTDKKTTDEQRTELITELANEAYEVSHDRPDISKTPRQKLQQATKKLAFMSRLKRSIDTKLQEEKLKSDQKLASSRQKVAPILQTAKRKQEEAKKKAEDDYSDDELEKDSYDGDSREPTPIHLSSRKLSLSSEQDLLPDTSRLSELVLPGRSVDMSEEKILIKGTKSYLKKFKELIDYIVLVSDDSINEDERVEKILIFLDKIFQVAHDSSSHSSEERSLFSDKQKHFMENLKLSIEKRLDNHLRLESTEKEGLAEEFDEDDHLEGEEVAGNSAAAVETEDHDEDAHSEEVAASFAGDGHLEGEEVAGNSEALALHLTNAVRWAASFDSSSADERGDDREAAGEISEGISVIANSEVSARDRLGDRYRVSLPDEEKQEINRANSEVRTRDEYRVSLAEEVSHSSSNGEGGDDREDEDLECLSTRANSEISVRYILEHRYRVSLAEREGQESQADESSHVAEAASSSNEGDVIIPIPVIAEHIAPHHDIVSELAGLNHEDIHME